MEDSTERIRHRLQACTSEVQAFSNKRIPFMDEIKEKNFRSHRSRGLIVRASLKIAVKAEAASLRQRMASLRQRDVPRSNEYNSTGTYLLTYTNNF